MTNLEKHYQMKAEVAVFYSSRDSKSAKLQKEVVS